MKTDPQPVDGDWNVSGCHQTRGEGGLKYCMKKLQAAKHREHIVLYSEGNVKRLTGHHETSFIDKFNFGEGSRACSCRIPIPTHNNGKEYFEDDLLLTLILICAVIIDTICLNSKCCDELVRTPLRIISKRECFGEAQIKSKTTVSRT